MLFKINQNEHRSKPLILRPLVKKITGTATFPEPFYDLGDNDQFDWNKLIGISFNPLKPDQNAIMIAWRYNLDTNKVAVGPYFNVNSERITPEKLQPTQKYWFEIHKEIPIKFEITYKEIKFWNSVTGQFMIVPTPSNLKTKWFTSFLVQPWFGGNRTPSNEIFIDIKYEVS